MQGWRENATGNQSLLLLGVAFQTAGNDPRHGLVALAHQHLFAISDELNMGAELRFQIADIDRSHVAIIADVTMLVICLFCCLECQGQGASGGAPMRKGPKDESIISHASVSRPVSSFSTLALKLLLRHLAGLVQPGCTIEVLPVLIAPSEALKPQSNPMWFVQSGCTNSAANAPGNFPKGFVYPRESLYCRALPIVDYIRLLFATCQALSCSLCPVHIDGVVMQVEITGSFSPQKNTPALPTVVVTPEEGQPSYASFSRRPRQTA